MPDKQITLYLLSHAKTAERADRHSFSLINKISIIHNMNLQTTRSRDEANLCLANMVALARDYVDPTTNRQTPITQCEKMRAAGTWLINGVWDPQWRMRCMIKARHRLQPKVVAEKGVDRDVTSLLSKLRHDHFFVTTPDEHIKSQTTLVRGAVLAVMASGARPGEVADWRWDACSWTDTFVEFIGPGKGKKKHQRYRLFRFTRTPQLCPLTAMREVWVYEAAKAKQSTTSLTGPVWTDASREPWSARHISNAIACTLRSAGLPDEHPYWLKGCMVNLLRNGGVQETDIARFVRHDPGAANLNRFYVANDFGQAVSQVMDSLVKRSDSKVCYMAI